MARRPQYICDIFGEEAGPNEKEGLVAYISCPISGYPNWQEEAERARQDLLNAGYKAVMIPSDFSAWPHRLGTTECPRVRKEGHVSEHSYACHIRGDLVGMLVSCHEVWMMKGWEGSEGCRLELNVAAACGMPVYFFEE